MIRAATLEDVPRIVAMGCRFLVETSYKGRIAMNPEAMAAIVRRLIVEPYGVVFVSVRDGDLTGMIGAFVYTHPISDEVVASELFWWTEGSSRGHGIRLLRRVEQWAKAMQAERLQMIAPTEDVERIYKALHYERVEVNYQRTLA